MISAQIDELRNAAEFYDGFQAANLMRDAADTIWQLRDDLQRTNAENAKLRELVDYMTPIALYGASEQERDRMRELGVDA